MKTILYRSYTCATTTSTPNPTLPPKHQHPPVPLQARGSIINKHSFKDSCYSTQWSRPLFHAHTLSHTPPHLFLFLLCLWTSTNTHTHTHTHHHALSRLLSPPDGSGTENITKPDAPHPPRLPALPALLLSAVPSFLQLLNVRYKVSGWCAHRMHRGMWARLLLPAPRADIVNQSGRAAAPRGLRD